MSEVHEITELSDLQTVLANAEGKVVVKFTAPAWCVPCQRFAPHYSAASEKSDAFFVSVDVDKAPWAMVEYGVQGVPTVVLFENGERVRDLKERTTLKLLSELA